MQFSNLLLGAVTAALLITQIRAIDAFCPPDVHHITLQTAGTSDIKRENAAQDGELARNGNVPEMMLRRPATFATPLQLNGPLTAALNGT